MNFDLSNGDVGDAGGAVGVGAGEGEDFVELFTKGGGKGAVPDSVDDDEAAVFLGIDGNEFAADGADGEAVQFKLIEVLTEADKGRRVVGVHHANLLTLEKALVPGMLLFLSSELHGAFPRLVLLRFRLRLGLQVLLNDAEVFEVGEFHEDKITKRILIFVGVNGLFHGRADSERT